MDNKFLIPSSIVLAGVIVAGALIYTKYPTLNNQIGAGPAPLGLANSLDALKIKKSDFILGNPSAKVVIVEYGDFQCPFCGKFFKTIESDLREQYIKTGKAAFVWRDFAFLGEESFRASEAAKCAGDQGKFWEYHDYLFNSQKGENQGAFKDENLKQFAKLLGLSEASFNSCFDSGKYRKDVEASVAEGKASGVSGTPTAFINGKGITGALPFSEYSSAIDAALK